MAQMATFTATPFQNIKKIKKNNGSSSKTSRISQRISGAGTPILPLKPIAENNVYVAETTDFETDFTQYIANNKDIDITDISPRTSTTSVAIELYSASVSRSGSARVSFSLESSTDSEMLSSELFDMARCILSKESNSSDLGVSNKYE